MTAREEFEIIYAEKEKAVKSYFSKRVPYEEVDDLTQQTFLKLWAYLSGVQNVRSYKALVFTVAKSVLTDYYRKKGNFISLEESAENLSALYSVDFEDTVVMRSLLATLSPEEKTIIDLKAKGYSSGEIGKIFGISASAVRTRLQSIRKKLK